MRNDGLRLPTLCTLAAAGVLLAGCASEPETVIVTSTTFVEAADDAEPAQDPSPAAAEDPAPGPAPDALELDTVYKGQVGGNCGTTPEGAKIRAGDNTSCEFAAMVYNRAIAATWTMTNNPTVTSIPVTTLTGVPSPVTDETYDLKCSVGSDSQSMSCAEADGSPSVTFTFPGYETGWHHYINLA